MTQMSLSDADVMDANLPQRKRCRILLTDVTTGRRADGHVMMGTCRMKGGSVHDVECRGCCLYQERSR